jgi:phage host-nuclease inhibitor protein Gam
MEHIITMLRTLERLEAQHTLRRTEYEQAKEAAIPESVRAQLAAIDAAYQADLEGMALEIAQLETECKLAVCAYGQTVRGGGYTATYTSGRVSWDNGFLKGYAASNPEILRGQKVGEPYVVLRKGGK